MVLYPNKLPESERVCSGICSFSLYFDIDSIIYFRIDYAVKLM